MKLFFTLILCAVGYFAFAQTIVSPNKNLSLSFSLTTDGEPAYQLKIGQKSAINTSKLGLELRDQPSFNKGFTISKIDTTSFDETWTPVWGEVSQIRNQYRELTITLAQVSSARSIRIRFRLFNDGVGFRYEFPAQPKLDHFIITNEKTEFNLTGDHKTFWIPGDYDTNEYNYYTTKLSETIPEKGKVADEISARFPIANTIQTPLMMKTQDGLYINIHEAALINYPAMILEVNRSAFSLTSHLVSDAVGNKAYLQTPFNTPWRTVIVSNKAADILASKTILNLNEPSKIKDVSWIQPMKYVGIWWEMHINKATWSYADAASTTLTATDWRGITPNGKHGATTENTKRYIDFAARHGFDGVLVEGWNVGWEDWFGKWKEDVFDFVTPYPDFDVKELQRYAASRHVKIIMHHETSASVTNYDRRLDAAFQFMKDNGYDAVKSGYVGRIIPRGEHHDSQWTINHFNRVAEKTAQYKIMLDAHEPVRPTGLHRTYPNWLACEAARGNEFNAWSVGNPPDHETILPFTRLMGGPMDYTPGIFQVKMNHYDPNKKEQVHTTLTKQLALYVTMYSPLQMAADLPENYEHFMDAFQFIKDVAVDWDDTKIIEAEPGDFVTIARKAKGQNDWYVGAITDEQKRNSTIPLSFLEPKQNYVATIYADAPNAHWQENPMAYQIQKFLVTDKTIINVTLANGGGAAISLKPATIDDMKKLKPYKSTK
ncbi:MAG TPA: glycoside hydrolase family 97 protein [Cyclobacteriaceae bacterium]|nr:glycoside hydrolase family 97 protein [Cyclobacteriaceae bacterium]